MALYRGLPDGQERWDDLTRPLTRGLQGSADKPDFDYTNFGLLFPQNDTSEIAYMLFQLPHDYDPESSLYPHIHFVQDSADQPTFKIDYRLYENNSDPTGSFTTLSLSSFKYSYTSGTILQIAYSSPISGSGIDTLSAMLEIRLYRDDNVVTGDVLAKELDVHYQRKGWGSRSEYEL